MKLVLRIAICVGLVSLNFGAKLPPSFIKCDVKQNDFQQCLTKAVQNAIRQMNRSFKEVNLLNMEPLEIPELTISSGSQIVYAIQNYKNVKVSGFNETTCSKVEFDTDTKILKLDCIVPRFRADFDYEVQGQILLISVYGHGVGWAMFHDNHLELTLKLGEYEKKGKKYYNVITQQFSMQPKNIDIDLTNLFDGDEEAADRFKKILRENIMEVYADVKSGFDEAYAIIFSSIFDRLLAKVPVVYLFGEK